LGLFDRFKSSTARMQEGTTVRRSYEWYEKGLSLFLAGHNGEAIPCFDMSLEIDPNYEDAWARKAYALFNLNRFQEAIPCFDRSLELAKKPDYYMWQLKGRALARLGYDQEAISCFDRSLELNPNKNKTWIGKGEALARLGCDQEAISCFDRSLELNPSDVAAEMNRQGVLERNRNTAKN